jgi:RNA-directed DNA polymerase
MPTKTVGPERALTWAGEPVNTEAEGLANRRGTLDTTTVNGPEDALDWDAIDWRAHEHNVTRLRRRIFTATRERDWATARSLQKMTAPRGALSYPRRSREELEGRFLGLMANLNPKW